MVVISHSSVQILGGVDCVLNGAPAGIGNGDTPGRLWDKVSQSVVSKMRLRGIVPHRRMKLYYHLHSARFRVRRRTDPA